MAQGPEQSTGVFLTNAREDLLTTATCKMCGAAARDCPSFHPQAPSSLEICLSLGLHLQPFSALGVKALRKNTLMCKFVNCSYQLDTPRVNWLQLPALLTPIAMYYKSSHSQGTKLLSCFLIIINYKDTITHVCNL